MLQAKPLLQRVVLLYAPGLSAALFQRRRAALPSLAALLGAPATVTAKSAMVHPGELRRPAESSGP